MKLIAGFNAISAIPGENFLYISKSYWIKTRKLKEYERQQVPI
jgi:hypothetical protein